MDPNSPLQPIDSVTLRPRGLLRIVPVAFLSAWLCAWAFGEWFGLSLAAGALHSFGLLPELHGMMKAATPHAAALPVIGFAALWLTLWTLGGFGASWTLAGLLAGRDEIAWDRESVEVRHAIGPFGSTTRFALADVMRSSSIPRFGLTARVGGQRRSLTTFGTATEREALYARLAATWQATQTAGGTAVASAFADVPGDGALPRSWIAAPDVSGQLALREGPGAKRLVVTVLLGFATALGIAVWRNVVAQAGLSGPLLPLAGVGLLSFFALLLAALAGSAALTRRSWRSSPGSLTEIVAWPGGSRERTWTSARLALELSTDSDGDDTWRLAIHGEGAPVANVAGPSTRPAELVQVGRWLSRQTGFPFDEMPGARSSAAS